MKYKLSEIGKVVGGGTPSTKQPEYYTDSEIPWITPKDLSGYDKMFISKGNRDITKSGLENSSAKLLPAKSILVSSRAPIGYVAIAKNKIATNQGFKSIIPNESLVIPEYLYFVMKTSKQNLEQIASGSTFKEISTKVMSNFEVDIPSMNEQKRILRYLLPITRKIEKNIKINDNLLELAKEIYQKEIASSSLIKTTLKDIATITMGQSPNSKTYNVEGIGIELLNGAADFRNGIHPSKWTTDPKKIVQKGAYIFGVRATVGLTRKVFKKYAIGRGTGSATAKAPVNDEFLYFVLDDMFKYFSNSGSGSVYINISKSDINNYTVHMPQDNGLESFHQIVGPIMKKIHANEQECLELIKMRETLLNKFF